MSANAINEIDIDTELAQIAARQAELRASRDQKQAGAIVKSLLQIVAKNQYEDFKTFQKFEDQPPEVKKAVVDIMTQKAEFEDKDAQFLLSQMHGKSFLGEGYWYDKENKWLRKAAENGSSQAFVRLAEKANDYQPSSSDHRRAAIYQLLAGDLTQSFGNASGKIYSKESHMAQIFGQMATSEQIAKLREMVGLSPEPPKPQGLG